MSASGLEPTRTQQAVRSRRLALVLALVAAGFYVGFIAVSVLAGRH